LQDDANLRKVYSTAPPPQCFTFVSRFLEERYGPTTTVTSVSLKIKKKKNTASANNLVVVAVELGKVTISERNLATCCSEQRQQYR